MVIRKREGEIVPSNKNARPMGLFSELDRMFDDMDSWFWRPSFALTPRMASEGFRTPKINVQDKGDTFVVTAEMPGISKENLELNIHENVLEISAKEKVEKTEEDEDNGYVYREMRSSSYHRRIPFARDIVPEQSEAELKNGMLVINLKKAEKEKPEKHSIAVK